MSNDSYKISWKLGTTVSVVAGALAVYLPSLGAAGVIAAMGSGSLSILASAATGGTLNVKYEWYQVGITTPQYRYYWSFKASTGDTYGPYLYHVNY